MLPIIYIYGKFFIYAFLDDRTGAWTLGNFKFLTNSVQLGKATIQPVGAAMKNTIVFTVIVTFFEVTFSCMAGYALSRLEFVGKQMITRSLLILRMFPGVLLLIGVVYVLMTLGIVDTLFGVIIVAVAFRLPGSSFIIRSFFAQVPRDIENSALIDGCNRFSAFFQVIIYLVKPGIASISIFSFMAAWSNYLLFNVLIFNSKTPVLGTYLRMVSTNDEMIADYGVFCAMALIYMLPVVIFFLISQKQLMEGNVSGGKGI
ncbi:carbohydrate ABC transporter permease [uncultured Clostridium sp.]|uniref:carbohydrate ABC transporter permease n=1 Tax=uncultured Clostridium sp. TaxID=59620 RepID=UPI00258E17CD|nr:carbohydrate ABC transporter permease [uncultured Clostridium sp.]MDU3396476.1 carbohydrate ABC transporter permease [Clostridiales bacterium]